MDKKHDKIDIKKMRKAKINAKGRKKNERKKKK